MKITLESTVYKEHRKVIIESERDDLDIYEVWDDLIRPTLLAYGYGEKVIDSILQKP